MANISKETYEKWRGHCEHTQAYTGKRLRKESPAQKKKRVARLLASYPDFCEYYFPHFMEGEGGRTIHNAPFHNAAAREVLRDKNLHAVFMWPRGHAKSTHFDVFIPLWLMLREPAELHVMVLVGKSEESACKLLSDLQAELEYNALIADDFGEMRGEGSWADGHFVTKGGTAFFALGRGQSPRGLRHKQARPDYIVIDDLDDDELCRNPRRVREAAEWVRSALFGALDVGRGRFIMVGNLIAKDSVLADIAATKGVKLSRVDALGKDGETAWKDKWTREEADAAAQFMGYRAWQKEMMNNPIQAGGIFRAEWIRWKKALPLQRYDRLVCYTDPSFKSSGNDFKASRLWGKAGDELHLIDAYVRQDSITGMVRWLYDLYERIPRGAATFYMEANFMQDLILDEFTAEGKARGFQLPIMADRRKKPDKVQRIEAISPLWERGMVYYNKDKEHDPDFITGIEQTLAIEHGSKAHDDAPDADEGAIFYLQKADRAAAMKPRFGKRHRPRGAW